MDEMSARDFLLPRLDRDIDIALQQASNLDGRSQSVGTTISLVLTLAGVIVAANQSFVKAIRLADASWIFLAAASLFVIALLLSFYAAMPRPAVSADAKFYKETLSEELSQHRVDQVEFVKAMSDSIVKMDTTTAETLRLIQNANLSRGRVFTVSLLFLFLGVMASIAATIVTVART